MSFTPFNGRNTVGVGRMPRVGGVRLREELWFDGDIVSATVCLEADRRFVSFQVDTDELVPARHREPTVGIAMNVKTPVRLSDGVAVANPARCNPCGPRRAGNSGVWSCSRTHRHRRLAALGI